MLVIYYKKSIVLQAISLGAVMFFFAIMQYTKGNAYAVALFGVAGMCSIFLAIIFSRMEYLKLDRERRLLHFRRGVFRKVTVVLGKATLKDNGNLGCLVMDEHNKSHLIHKKLLTDIDFQRIVDEFKLLSVSVRDVQEIANHEAAKNKIPQ